MSIRDPSPGVFSSASCCASTALSCPGCRGQRRGRAGRPRADGGGKTTYLLPDAGQVGRLCAQCVGNVALALGLLRLLQPLVKPLQFLRVLLLHLIEERLVEGEGVRCRSEAVVWGHLVGLDSLQQGVARIIVELGEGVLEEGVVVLWELKVGYWEDDIFCHGRWMLQESSARD